MAKRLQESLRHCRMARRTPMTVGKKMNRIGHHVVEIDANMRKLAKNRRGKAEFRAKEIACALMGQDHRHTLRRFFPDSAQDETDNFDRLLGSKLSEAGSLDDLSKTLAVTLANRDQSLQRSNGPMDGGRKTNEPCISRRMALLDRRNAVSIHQNSRSR